MLLLGKKAGELDEAREHAEQVLRGGEPWEKFRAMIQAQGGELAYIDDPGKLPSAPIIERVTTPRDGYLSALNAREVGLTVVEMGGGREKKEDDIDPSVGVLLRAKVGDRLQQGQPLLEIHAASEPDMGRARERLLAALAFSDSPIEPPPLFYDVISSVDVASRGGGMGQE
jgi:pyrimidine-nucleoside phosphorylase